MAQAANMRSYYNDNDPFARVGRLRAYGNAIVPQAAAAFVMAYMET